MQWIIKLIYASIGSDWQKALKLGLEKIAKMELSFPRIIEGLLLTVMAGCGALLFALMSATDPDERFIYSLGFTGIVSGGACIITELYMWTLKRDKESKRLQNQEGQSEESVDACSWWFVATSFFLTTSVTAFMCIYAFARVPEFYAIGVLIFPISFTSMVLSIFMRPRDQNLGILHSQFFTFAVVAELSKAYENFKIAPHASAFALVRIPIWCLAYRLVLRTRRRAALLSRTELSNFLCKTVLVDGGRAMAPMVFFTFETVSCLTSNGIGNDLCANTSNAAMFLSFYLAIIASVSIARKTVPRKERGEGLTYINLAALSLTWRQTIQGALVAMTALASMYLFSVLGVEGLPNGLVFGIAAIGGATMSAAALVEIFTFAVRGSRVEREQLAETPGTQRRDLSGTKDFRSDRRLSLGGIEDDMTGIGMV